MKQGKDTARERKQNSVKHKYAVKRRNTNGSLSKEGRESKRKKYKETEVDRKVGMKNKIIG
jgi:hypothetical protein